MSEQGGNLGYISCVLSWSRVSAASENKSLEEALTNFNCYSLQGKSNKEHELYSTQYKEHQCFILFTTTSSDTVLISIFLANGLIKENKQ